MAAGTGGAARADVDRTSDVDASSSAMATMAGARSRGGILSSQFCPCPGIQGVGPPNICWSAGGTRFPDGRPQLRALLHGEFGL